MQTLEGNHKGTEKCNKLQQPYTSSAHTKIAIKSEQWRDQEQNQVIQNTRIQREIKMRRILEAALMKFFIFLIKKGFIVIRQYRSFSALLDKPMLLFFKKRSLLKKTTLSELMYAYFSSENKRSILVFSLPANTKQSKK